MRDRTRKFLSGPHIWVIRLFGLIVPRRLRSDWRQEWEAELRHREAMLEGWERLNCGTKLDLLRRSLGAFWDALWFQRERLEEDMFQDLRYGLRMLGRTPVFTTVAVLSLMLGIGANTAIFSLINAVLLKTLPVKNPEQLVLLRWVSGPKMPPKSLSGGLDTTNGQRTSTSFSYPAFEQFRDNNEVFSDTLAFAELERLNVGIDGQSELAGGQVVSGEYYSALGVRAAVGRTITQDDDKASDPQPVAVISYAYWQRRFGRDQDVLGKVIYLNGSPFTIIGVSQQGFNGTLQVGSAPEITVPMAAEAILTKADPALGQPDYWWLQIIGRLKPGVSQEQARANLDVLYQQSVAEIQKPSDENTDVTRLEVTPGGRGLNDTRKEFLQPLFILMVVVGLVLAIACVNIANLMLARAATRRKEIAVRLALGASRLRLIRQLLTESTLLAMIGGALGLILAYWGKGFLLTLLSNRSNSLTLDLSPDARILGFTAAVSLLTGIAFGIAPALRATRVDLTPALKDNARSVSKGKSLLGKVLLVAQVAMSLLLLIGAGLFVRTLQNLGNVDLGFNRQNLLLFKIDPTLNGYKGAQVASLYRQMTERIEAIPGVRSVSLSRYALISSSAMIRNVSVPGYTPPPGEKKYVYVQKIAPNFLDTMEIPLLLGRNLSARDDEASHKVALINETFARTYFPDENPVGRRISFDTRNNTDPIEIVGVSRDAKYSQVRGETPPTVYTPYLQNISGLGQMTFAVRTAGDPTEMIAAIRQAAQAVDSNVPLFDLKTQSEQVDQALAQERLFARLSAFFGLLALLLACIGLYGIMSYSVARRTHEIGIRVALGAQPGNVLWLVMRETLLLVLAGVAIGVPVALAAAKVISSMLFGLTATDPVTIFIAMFLMMGVGAFAGYLPARRASRVDPIVALRYE
jgi:predicted permease